MTLYDGVNGVLMHRVAETKKCRIQQLFGAREMSVRQPIQFLRHLQELLGDPETYLDTTIHLKRFVQGLCTSSRTSLATLRSQTRPQLAELADRLLQESEPTVSVTLVNVLSDDTAGLSTSLRPQLRRGYLFRLCSRLSYCIQPVMHMDLNSPTGPCSILT